MKNSYDQTAKLLRDSDSSFNKNSFKTDEEFKIDHNPMNRSDHNTQNKQEPKQQSHN